MRSLRRLLPTLLATAVAGATLAVVAPAGPAAAAPTDVKINEVESNGDTQDWIELTNVGTETIDLTGWRLSDNSADEIAISGTLAPGQFRAFDTDVDGVDGEFGLGGNDLAEVFPAGSTTAVDTYTWATHAATTYARCPDGTGAFRTATTSTKNAANNCTSPVRINEIESNGGTPDDWVELVNPSAATVDVSGFVFQDNSTAAYTIPAGTTIPAGGFLVLENPTQFSFGLGSADSARLFNGATLVDTYTWTAHATTTYGRCPNPQGEFATTATPTKGTANDCGITVPTTLKINEVESNGDPIGDFVELKNTGATPVDISGFKFRDNDPTHNQVSIPAGTVVAPGGYYVLAESFFIFGLGAPDSATIWLPDGTTVVDSYDWTAHASTTYGRCPDGTGTFTTTGASTRGAANDCTSTVRINEVESDGGTPGDWVELINTATTAANVSGFVVKDAGEPGYTIPAGTTIPGGGYLVVEQAQLGAALDAADSARLLAADGTTVLDSYSWTAHASTSYGRCPNGTGTITTTQVVTKGAANNCPGDIVTQPWPGGADVTTVDPQGTFPSNLSGLMHEPSGTSAPGNLWAVRNGPGALFRLTPTTGGGYAPTGEWASGKLLRYGDGTGDVDAEGVTFTSAGPAAGVFVASERNNGASSVSRPAILRYSPGDAGPLVPTNDWNLTSDLPGLGANLGLEGIAWVPDSYLTARGFRDNNTGAAYDPATYPNHGTGLFLVGVEQTGTVYAYALDLTAGSGAFTRVASFASGFPSVMELAFEVETQKLWVVCDDTCTGRHAVFDVNGSGVFAAETYYERPTGLPNLNNEGFTIAPRAECVGGRKPVFWSDDSGTGGFAIRRGTLRCTDTTPQTVSFTSTPPASPVVGGTYPVTATGGASGNPVTFSSDTPTVCSVSGATVTLLTAGTCTVRASQAGNDTFAPGTATQGVTVARAPQTVTFTSTPPASPAIASTYTVSATGGASGNPVTFSSDTPTVCTVAGMTVTFDHAGTCTVRASQAGNASYDAGTATQSIVVPRLAQTITFTSNPPTSPVVGQTYTVAATGGASGNPVTFSEASDACSLSGDTVTILAPGPCVVVANQAGTADYAPATAAQTRTAVKAATTTTVTAAATSLRAVVAVVAPGAAPITGDAVFLVDGAFVGAAPVVDGVATLTYTAEPGETRNVTANYPGSPLLAASTGTTQRRDPLVTFRLTSTVPPTADGWWSEPVTVTFTCTPQGSPVTSCPEPVVLDQSGADVGLTRTATAENGGVGTVVVDNVQIDLDAPTAGVGGVRNGATYPLDPPAATCVGIDALSGLESCVLRTTRSGLSTTVTAVATDVAGNTSTASVTWRRPVVRVGGALRVNADGAYVVDADRYRVVVMLPAAARPRLLGPVYADRRFTGDGRALRAGAVVGGLVTWSLPFRPLNGGRDQKLAVQVGARRIVVPLRYIGPVVTTQGPDRG